MSYDVHIEWQTDDLPEPAFLCDVGNMTSNVGPMYNRALPHLHAEGGRYDGDQARLPEPMPGLRGLSGLRCAYALPFLQAGVDYMNAHFDEMRALEAPNGWGKAGNAEDFLKRQLLACALHPQGTICVNW